MKVSNEVIERVRKLLAMAADKGSENEARIALEKARAIMHEYSISSFDLEKQEEYDVEIEHFSTDPLSQVDSWDRFLISGIARLFDVQNWTVRMGPPKYKVRVCFAGERTDVALTLQVWPWMKSLIKKIAAELYGKSWNSSHRTFAESFALRIQQRVIEIEHQEEEKLKSGLATVDETKYGLIVVKKEDALEKWFKINGIELKFSKRSLTGKFDVNAHNAGVNAADKVNLNFRKQIHGSESTKLLN